MIEVITNHPVAYESPDHLHPHGTANDNSTNKNFVKEIKEYFNNKPFNFLDLGCSGGQLVVDISKLDPDVVAVGLEGSDYSVKHNRGHWQNSYNSNLFTCDITHPFEVKINGNLGKFNLITAWEVLEHIPPHLLDSVFKNIYNHLADDGIFAASINMSSDKPKGVELHLTREKPPFWEKVFFKNNFEMIGEGIYSTSTAHYAHHYIFKNRVRGRSNGKSFWTTLKKKI